ncbi:Transcriptional activator protein CzcR [Posidoniimonas polymericola]|uniref:Transcriptional activator protein CzcR n=1 Tax=Posidoniimonas polymericola TaxID=2528002 RepID=A0A5C5YSA2_9BACT|nr:response regulator [Posidoniimonas polymericola]TWT77663.1 Transcriptional activator protein CzcR [Posidoniimonas polymericola]
MASTIHLAPLVGSAAPQRPPAQPTILCIDDDPEIHTGLALRMAEYHVHVEHAYYGEQGISDALETRPDLIITDVRMPGGDGKDLIQAIRTQASTIAVPIIVLTGVRDPALRARLRSAGADAFLQKPVPVAQLIQLMETFIELRRA